MSLSVQFFSLLAMIGTGIAAGVIMDLFCTIKNLFSKRSFIRRRSFWFEIIVWAGIGAGAFWVLLTVRDGAWRMYDPVAQVSGMLLYAAIFHYPFRFAGRWFWLLIIRPVWLLITFIMRVIQRIVRALIVSIMWIISPVLRLGKVIGKSLQKKGKVLYNREQ